MSKVSLGRSCGLNWRLKGKCFCAVCIVVSLIMVVLFTQNTDQTVQASVNLQPITLTVIGANGTSVVLHEGDIGSYTSYTAYGGFINSLGNLGGLGTYTGVPINTLCNLVGGVHYGQTLLVNATDNYKWNFTYEQVNGDFVTYSNTTPSHRVSHNKPLTTMLAYYLNGKNLTSGPDGDGPLRFVIVGPEGLCTNSTYWVKRVWKLQVFKMLGDVNGDGIIDCKDLRRIGKGFGATTGQPLYDPDADVNSDGIIDRSDLKILAKNFGQ
jgi:hypothetical protein